MLGLEQPETRLLLACARPRADESSNAVLDALAAGAIDWTELIELALQHGVTPALATAFAEERGLDVPADIQAALQQYCDAARERNTTLAVELRGILAALTDLGIAALPFKGPLLAELLYGDLGQRAPGDIDFLVRLRDVTRTCDLLSSRGYRDAHRSPVTMTATQHGMYRRYQCEYQFVREVDGSVAEPHWAFAQRMWVMQLDYEGQFVRACRGRLAGAPVLRHAAEDLLLLLCVHGAKHEWERLVWIRDVAALLERRADLGLDLDLALARAREQGCARLILVGLNLAHCLLGARLSPSLHQAVRDDREVAALTTQVTARLFLRDRPDRTNRRITRFGFRIHQGAASRGRYVARALLLPRREHIEMVALPPSLVWLYYPLRWGHDYLALPIWNLARPPWKRRVPATHAE